MNKSTAVKLVPVELELESNVERYGVYALCIVYTLAHGWILLIPNALYWDDWTMHELSAADLLNIFSQGGSILNLGGHVNLLLQNAGSWSYKAVVFFSYLGSGILLNKILKRSGYFSCDSRFFIVLLYLVLPLNFARIAQINIFYAISNFSFLLAWLLMDRYRMVASFLFLFAFGTNSLLVFYALPFVDYLFRHRRCIFLKSWQRWISVLLFFVLPFIYWGVKNSFYKPSGMYAGYNQNLSIENVVPAVRAQLIDVFNAFGLGRSAFIIVLIASVSVLLLLVRRARERDGLKGLALTFSGMLLIALACFPYWILGLVPSIWEWSSRHQLLMPLGVAVLGAGLLHIFGLKARMVSVVLVVAISVLCWAAVYITAYFDWKKQESLVRLLSENEAIRGARLVAIDDETTDLNVLNRTYRFYEWNGLMEKAFGDQTRFAVSRSDVEPYFQGRFDRYFEAHYKSGQHVRDVATPPLYVRIRYGDRVAESIVISGFDRVNSLTVSVD